MRIESSVTSLSWIPSEAITGVTRIPFDRGITHYDDPPPDQWQDLAAVVGPEGARFANELRAWVEVQDGKIVACGQTGAGRVSSTLASIGGMHVLVEAVGYPLLRQETGTGTDFVRFAQTAGGRPGVPVGASAFPRHWIYGADGKLAGKSALIDFRTWYRTAGLAQSPWGGHEHAVLAADAETPLERRLSMDIMHGGPKPRPVMVPPGTTIMAEGEAADQIVLVLDGMVQVEVGGSVLAELGPGAVLGERASLEEGRRTATIRALTDCRIVSYPAAALPLADLRQLAGGHHREDEG